MSEVEHVQRITGEHFQMDLFIDPYNKRLRVDDYRGDVSQVVEKVEELAVHLKSEKMIIIGRREHYTSLLEKAFQCEAVVDHFFNGSDAYYFTKFSSMERKQNAHWIIEDRTIKSVSKLARNQAKKVIPTGYELKKLYKKDAKPLVQLYQEVFQIYPTPLHDPEYIRETMERGTIYYGFIHEDNIVSAASAEVNDRYHNAELTDCATLLSYRKYGLMKHVLEKLAGELKKNRIYCAYSIARAQSFGMNAVLHQLGYEYRGRLMNNCYIFDKLENMNMWVKDLSYLNEQ
ncbi:putative beta-lysine N-acetyltransferase [Bacillus sp. V3B]|uniref:putative beta-lysine N-acetyltransferase n=1 Tax=Bacillus sp. V3B TaxID=2804915 RepID=UPI00210F22B1|nr:putative beta-lysine N-acetyltransferase [Bacillus sp. V3B]